VKPSGNVYCFQAVDELNIKTKSWKCVGSSGGAAAALTARLTQGLADGRAVQAKVRPAAAQVRTRSDALLSSDIIVLQDPLNLSGRMLTEFDHVRSGLRADERPSGGIHSVNTNLSGDMARALKHLDTDTARAAFDAGGGGRAAQAERMLAAAKQAAAPAVAVAPSGVVGLDAPLFSFKPGTHTWNSDVGAAAGGAVQAAAAPAAPGAARPPSAPEARPSAARAGVVSGSTTAVMRSNGACAASFTSSAAAVVTRNEAAAPAPSEVRATRKAYVALHTSKGDLNLELHADLVPRACQNFLLLAARGFYDGVAFHRSIRNFMLQGGDPSGSGRGGESAWGRPFADEFVQSLSHSGRGVVAMANAGAHSNGSQFFILYKSAPHLDKKHTVFGRVVGGMDTTLSALERVPTDADDRPTEEIRIESITVFDDPFGAQRSGACIGFSVCCVTDTLRLQPTRSQPPPASRKQRSLLKRRRGVSGGLTPRAHATASYRSMAASASSCRR
jgi:peptidyl-prolyl cis-trans isomerase-like protein 2